MKLQKFDSAWNAIGRPPEEAEIMKVRCQLAIALNGLIGKRGLNTHEADALLGVSQPRISELAHRYVLKPGKVHTDDIPVPVQEPGSGKTRTARLWVYVRDDRNAGSQLPPQCGSRTCRTAGESIHSKTLPGYGGILQAHAYGGYNALYEDGRITEAACMAYASRKIHDVHARTPTGITTEALKRIGELYAIKAEIRGSQADERLAVRKKRTTPQMQ